MKIRSAGLEKEVPSDDPEAVHNKKHGRGVLIDEELLRVFAGWNPDVWMLPRAGETLGDPGSTDHLPGLRTMEYRLTVTEGMGGGSYLPVRRYPSRPVPHRRARTLTAAYRSDALPPRIGDGSNLAGFALLALVSAGGIGTWRMTRRS